MITRREFLKDMALGGMVLSLDPISLFASPERPFEIMADTASLPVWKDVDVLIAGSSTGAVAAAVAAARAGAKVLVVSPYTYPGEDVCASFRFWGNDSDSASELYRSVFPGSIAPQPLQVKSALETAMIGNGVDFLYSSFVSSILVDGAGAVSGVCISNRSGVQAVRAKVVIDATLEATVARMAGVPFHPFRPGKHRFVHTVVGASLKSDPRIVSAEEIFPAFNTNDKSYAGTVSDISIVNTRIVTMDNKVITLPNGALSNGNIKNYSGRPVRRVEWKVSVEYDSDADACIELIKALLSRDKRILNSSVPEAEDPFAALFSLNESDITFIARAWVRQDDYWNVYFDINKVLYTELPLNGFIFAYPHMTISNS